jgi:hypothetical protein
MVNIEHFDDMCLFVDAVDDAVGPAACPMAASQRAEEWLADPARAQGQGRLTEFKHRRCYRLGEPFGDGAARSSLEPCFIRLTVHVPR